MSKQKQFDMETEFANPEHVKQNLKPSKITP